MGFKYGKTVSTLTLYLTETLNWYVCSVLECRSFCFFWFRAGNLCYGWVHKFEIVAVKLFNCIGLSLYLGLNVEN